MQCKTFFAKFCFRIASGKKPSKGLLREAAYKEDGDPCQTDVVERDGAAEGVHVTGLALCVVLIPVDAVCLIVKSRIDVTGTFTRVLDEIWQL